MVAYKTKPAKLKMKTDIPYSCMLYDSYPSTLNPTSRRCVCRCSPEDSRTQLFPPPDLRSYVRVRGVIPIARPHQHPQNPDMTYCRKSHDGPILLDMRICTVLHGPIYPGHFGGTPELYWQFPDGTSAIELDNGPMHGRAAPIPSARQIHRWGSLFFLCIYRRR